MPDAAPLPDRENRAAAHLFPRIQAHASYRVIFSFPSGRRVAAA